METPQATSIINKIEVILVSLFLAISVFDLLKYVAEYDPNTMPAYDFINSGLTYSPISNYLVPSLCRFLVLYFSYLLLHFVIIKNIANRVQITLNIVLVFLLFVIAATAYGVTETWLKAYLFNNINNPTDDHQAVYINLFAKNFINILPYFALYCAYCSVKYNPDILLKNIVGLDVQPVKALALRDCFVICITWFIVFSILYIGQFSNPVMLCWKYVASVSIMLYAFSSLVLIPSLKADGKKIRHYFIGMGLATAIIILLLVWLFRYVFQTPHYIQFIIPINAVIQLGLVAPAAWYIYENRQKSTAELTGLKTALGQSSANLDFLRSQINPHFLFNALNTLYGTALQENAGRTGEGIQKLGDMMRFMLQENQRDKISLTREVEYLKNYIDLQQLRVQTSPDILIETIIAEQLNYLQIAPMLLIPFVENAFKHGISLQEPSHIKISLHTDETQLFFDVHNSKHQKKNNDPERDNNGIGLENVAQRLELVYPGNHDLVIHESAREFFIHLVINLTA
ncbi:sensor histidine kinase [Mucilaginibacter corticis]|nr:histidine kinase [Mucilaginibacter corticis]